MGHVVILYMSLHYRTLLIVNFCFFQCVKSVQIRSFFWSVFSLIRTEFGDLRSKSPCSIRIMENTDQEKLRVWKLFTQSYFITNGNVEAVYPVISNTFCEKRALAQNHHESRPYKHTMWFPCWNDIETAVSTSFQRGIHVVCL